MSDTTSETPVFGGDKLTLWWERQNQQIRQAKIKDYPFPHDGASCANLNHEMGMEGLADERHGHKERLMAMMYLAKPIITERFLKLWPKRETTIKPFTEGEPDVTP